jgi:hypothetical protein
MHVKIFLGAFLGSALLVHSHINADGRFGLQVMPGILGLGGLYLSDHYGLGVSVGGHKDFKNNGESSFAVIDIATGFRHQLHEDIYFYGGFGVHQKVGRIFADRFVGVGQTIPSVSGASNRFVTYLVKFAPFLSVQKYFGCHILVSFGTSPVFAGWAQFNDKKRNAIVDFFKTGLSLAYMF